MRRLTAALAIVLAAATVGACGGSSGADASRSDGGHTPAATGGNDSRAGASGETDSRASGQTDSRAVVWAAGDVATPGPAADRVAALVRRGDPDLFLYLGDVYETGTAAEFRSWYHPRFGGLASITMPTIGNHESGNRFTGYYPYWAARKGHRQPPWSKRQIAGWEIIDLDSQAAHGPDSNQARWLERAVSGPGDCRIAFWHRPRYSAGAYRDAADLAPLWNRLAGHARIVLSGHDHNLQRHKPQRGIVQYVAGAGGRPRYILSHGSPTMAWGTDDIDGALRIVLKPGRALLEFRSSSGRLLDRSRRTCTT